MRWHAEERIDDGVFRHPADSLAWKDFDKRHSSFSGDIRNVKLGLASDGFNPFRSMNIAHSTWLIILVPYKHIGEQTRERHRFTWTGSRCNQWP